MSNNAYIQSELEHLISAYETEVNYTPLDIPLNAQHVSATDIPSLLYFLNNKRSRFFCFKIAGDKPTTELLTFTARRAVLNQTANTLLQNIPKEKKINPLKRALNQQSSPVKANIQIQKSFSLKGSSTLLKEKIQEIQQQTLSANLVLVPADLSAFPKLAELNKQLYLLGIEFLHDQALEQIKEYTSAFSDGIIPSNLPKGFYIDPVLKALCYTEHLKKIPSSLAPKLEKPLPPIWHSKTLIPHFLPHITQDKISLLLTEHYSKTQELTLMGILSSYSTEVEQILNGLKSSDLAFIVPFLAKQFIYGGDAHVCLLTKLFDACISNHISLDFIKHPETFNALASPNGIKNLQKLTQLSTEQKEWWNVLVQAHLANPEHSFDFNEFFEIYTQLFLPKITQNNLCLALPCPIKHQGHMLLLLNRIIDVLEHAKNPQEQCLLLSGLNWSATGIHYAMTQEKEGMRLKQAAACMDIQSPESLHTQPKHIYPHINNELLELQPWLFRYMGQNWHSEIKLKDIQKQLLKIEQLKWPKTQKNQLIFILACTFANKNPLSNEQLVEALDDCIQLLQSSNQQNRRELLQHYTQCFAFKSPPSLQHIASLFKLNIKLKNAFPNQHVENEIIKPLLSFVKSEGLELLTTLEECIKKLVGQEQYLSMLYSFISQINQRQALEKPESQLIELLAKLNVHPLTQTHIDSLEAAFKNLKTQKGESFYFFVLNFLNQINSSKSSALPTLEEIQYLIDKLLNLKSLPEPDQQKEWFKNYLVSNELLPHCVFGTDEISQLDELIISALVDSIKKRRSAFKINIIKDALLEKLRLPIVPESLRTQINREFIPLLDDMNALINLLQTPNPEFPEIIRKLQNFEEKKPLLLNSIYNIGMILGQTKGEYILSHLLTGKKKETDNITGYGLAGILNQLHQLFLDKMNGFFANPKNQVKDLTPEICLSWMETFNNTHSLTFFFKEELIEKKVIPALKKTLLQLNIKDNAFEKGILKDAAFLNEEEPAHHSLQKYKNKIEALASYLNSLIDLKNELSAQEFDQIYQLLNTGSLTRLSYEHKHILIHQLKNKKEFLSSLNLIMHILEEHPEAHGPAITQAMKGLDALFNLTDLDPETQMMFFKMSFIHNLKSPHPFPLEALNELKKTTIPEEIKSLITKQILNILTQLSHSNSSELITNTIQSTKQFLSATPELATLCNALLQRVAKKNADGELNHYLLTLQQLNQVNPANKACIINILTQLATNKNDAFSLSELLEISKRLSSQAPNNLDLIASLFRNSPFPTVQNLSAVLRAPDCEKLKAYCSNFDKNPFNNANNTRDLASQFSSHNVIKALTGLEDLLHETPLSQALLLKLGRQLSYLEILGYTDPLDPDNFQGLKKLTDCSRQDLQNNILILLTQLRTKQITPECLEKTQMDLLAHMREIYFRTTGLFPTSTQMLVLLLALHDPTSNLLMRIRTGEGKSIITPMLSVLQWTQGGTIDQFTANDTLLARDFENYCEPFFKFLQIPCALIQTDTPTEAYQLGGINCSTFELMANFRLEAKASNKEVLVKDSAPIHMILDECDEPLLEQILRFNLVAALDEEKSLNNHAQWIYLLTYQFINLPEFRNLDPKKGKVWDEEEDKRQFRIFLYKEINKQYQDSTEKLNKIMTSSDSQLMQWIHASCIAAKQVENKNFIIQPLKEKDEMSNEIIKKMVCVPLIRSTPKTGSIFTAGVQRALQARIQIEYPNLAHYFAIESDPPVIDSQSALSLISNYQKTKGRLLGISGTPGDKMELQNLATLFGIQAIGVPSHTPTKRINHPPVFTLSREESINAIFKAIHQVQKPITTPLMKLNPHQSPQIYEEIEALNAKKIKTIEQWKKTQTQPILIINEHFGDAKAIENHLTAFKNKGWTVQIVHGRESTEELTQILKQAGNPNTITVGTSMLAKGTDIDTKDNPRGLFVILTYTDIPRMMEQIPGRTARNNNPGEYLVIYEIKKPKSFWALILYYIFPWYRQKVNIQAIEELKNKIQLEATTNRLYTQAIDQIQQALMQHIEAWESIILELYPENFETQLELYQWREIFLNELNRFPLPSLSEKDLQLHINQFKKSACKLWNGIKEDKWIAKVHSVKTTRAQQITINFLKQLDIAQELDVQAPLYKTTQKIQESTQNFMHHNLDTLIQDKAGVVLEYDKPQGQAKKDLELAQSKQLLPHLLSELCLNFPHLFAQIKSSSVSSNPVYSSKLNAFIKLAIEQKERMSDGEKKQLKNNIQELYKKVFNNASLSQIKQIIEALSPLMLKKLTSSTKTSLFTQFKMQAVILTFCKIVQNLELSEPEQTQLTSLKSHYQDKIMENLADYLIKQYSWIDKEPLPLYHYLERRDAKIAAKTLYHLACKLKKNPQDAHCIEALYRALKEHQVILKNKYLFSIGHTSPRRVINESIKAIEALTYAPHCSKTFQIKAHDQALIQHHLNKFQNSLRQSDPYFYYEKDPIWEHLKQILLQMSNKRQPHIFKELQECVQRYSLYPAYQPYANSLLFLNKKLLQTIKELKKEDGLKQDVEESLYTQKTTEVASLLKLKPEQVCIQNGNDGLQSYIEIQLKNAPLQMGFTGYQSSFSPKLETERNRLLNEALNLKTIQQQLSCLENIQVLSTLPESAQKNFFPLFNLKVFLNQEWNEYTIKCLLTHSIPKTMEKKLKHLELFNQWDLQQLNEKGMQVLFGKNPDEKLIHLLEGVRDSQSNILEIQTQVNAQLKQINKIEGKIKQEEQLLRELQHSKEKTSASYLEKTFLQGQILYQQGFIMFHKGQIKLNQTKLSGLLEEQLASTHSLKEHQKALKAYKNKMVTKLTEEIKADLSSYLEEKSKNFIQQMVEEQQSVESALNKIQNMETVKSTNQTLKFYNSPAFFNYLADLKKEKAQIPRTRSKESSRADKHINDSILSSPKLN